MVLVLLNSRSTETRLPSAYCKDCVQQGKHHSGNDAAQSITTGYLMISYPIEAIRLLEEWTQTLPLDKAKTTPRRANQHSALFRAATLGGICRNSPSIPLGK